VQRAATASGPNVAPPIVHEVLQTPGQPLDAEIRSFMEPRFGHDFSQVRVHTNGRAADSAQAMNALAYTTGQHIAFDHGQYTPSTTAGRQLLAHELTHVVQQRMHAPEMQTALHEPADSSPYEHEASEMAQRVASGRAAGVPKQLDGSGIQRQSAGAGSGAGTNGASTAPPAPARPQREERFNVGRGGGRVDAELDRTQRLLTLKMKVRFNFVNAPNPWPSPAAQATWQSQFTRAVMDRWSFRHYLVPDSPCPDEPLTHAIARLQIIPVSSGEHFTVNAGYTTTFQTSSVSGRSATLDALDVSTRSDIPQVPVEHEFGHMLGLPHIHCNTNSSECYGVTSEESADVMGRGAIVSARDYMPFAEVMYYFNGCNWHPTQSLTGDGGSSVGRTLLGGLIGGAVGAGIGALFGPVGALVGGLIGLGAGALIGGLTA
jgi:hypothetical protein